MGKDLLSGEFEMLAKTMHGLEDILEGELKALGAKDIVPGRRMVAFKGDRRLLYQSNIFLRTALRILVPIDQFEATNPDEIYQHLYDHVAWDDYLTPRTTFVFDTVVYSDKFTHSKFVSYRAKDAIADYFKDKADRRPNVSVADPDVRFHIHIAETTVTIALDSSGESLHRRGYRLGQNDAPISEVLAAGILMRAGWEGQCDLLDPMCGSGTFLTEGALIALGIPPGIFRQQYAFERWADFDSELLSELLEDWEEKPFEHKIYGSDAHPKAIAISRGNIKNCGLAKHIDLQVKRFEDYTLENRPAENGMIVMNPPYGDRMRPFDLERLYESIGSTLKHVFTGWKAWIISGSIDEGFNAIGLKQFHREKLFNGMIETELRGYEMFEGKRNEHLAELEKMGLLPSVEEREEYYREREAYKQERQAYRKERRRTSRSSDNSYGRREERRPREDSRDRRGDRRDDRKNREYRERDFDRNDRRPAYSATPDRNERPIFTPRPNHEREPDNNE